MLLKDALLRDPSRYDLVNNGQARIQNESADEKMLAQLRGELSSFVCEGQYADGMARILESFLRGRTQPSQQAAWVSGFFGSGKSHLLKMLCHLWQDTEFSDGATARSLVPDLPQDVRSALLELDIAGRKSGGLLAAAVHCRPARRKTFVFRSSEFYFVQSSCRTNIRRHIFNCGSKSTVTLPR